MCMHVWVCVLFVRECRQRIESISIALSLSQGSCVCWANYQLSELVNWQVVELVMIATSLHHTYRLPLLRRLLACSTPPSFDQQCAAPLQVSVECGYVFGPQSHDWRHTGRTHENCKHENSLIARRVKMPIFGDCLCVFLH